MKFKVTQQQRNNALEALHVMWPSVPKKNVYKKLLNWRQRTTLNGEHDDYYAAPTCGTVACFGGWCEWWPNFRAQIGIKPDEARSAGWHEVTALFGDDSNEAIDNLLSMRGVHIADDGFVGSDHAMVSNRLRWLIDNSKVIA